MGTVLLLDCTHLDCESAVPNEAMLRIRIRISIQIRVLPFGEPWMEMRELPGMIFRCIAVQSIELPWKRQPRSFFDALRSFFYPIQIVEIEIIQYNKNHLTHLYNCYASSCCCCCCCCYNSTLQQRPNELSQHRNDIFFSSFSQFSNHIITTQRPLRRNSCVRIQGFHAQARIVESDCRRRF